MWDDVRADVKHSVRALARAPGQAAVLVLTLALGMGASAAIFSVLRGVLFAPLPFPDPDALVTVRHRPTAIDGVGLQGPGGADLLDYAEGAPSIEGFAGVQTLETNLNDGEGAARVTMGWTTPDYFRVMRIEAALGRALRPDDWAGADRARMEDPTFTPPPISVLLSDGLWTRRFGRDPDVLGRSVRLNGQSMEVVGVLPAGFRLMLPPDEDGVTTVDAMALMPVPLSDAGRGGSGLAVVARLRRGASLAQAREEIAAVATRLREVYPQHQRLGTEVVVEPLHAEVVADARPLLWTLFGAVALLLLISATNVANLLLVRAGRREREFAVRMALGVGRARLLRQLLTEGAVVAGLGTLAGLLVGAWTVDLLAAVRPGDLPRMEDVALDARVLALTAAVGAGVAVLFALAPAAALRGGPGRLLSAGRGSGEGTRASVRLRRVLVVTELAVSVVLVAGAGLLLRSFVGLQRVELGFEPDGVLAVDAAVPFFPYRDDAVRAGFFVRLAERAGQIPGVAAAGVTAALPLDDHGGGSWNAPYAPDEGGSLDDEQAPRVRYRAVTPGALAALGARLREGRDLAPADERDGDPVPIVIDARLADRHWPDGSLDRTLGMLVAGYTGAPRQVVGRVVGVVEPVRFASVAEASEPTVFVPYRLFAPVDGTLVLRTGRDPAAVAESVRAIVAELDGSVPVYGLRTVASVVRRATAQQRYAVALVGAFAAVALLLAAVGLYGVVSTLVHQRTAEIGVRIALGAPAGEVARLIAADGARLALPGLLAGLVAAVALAPALRSQLHGVAPTDPLTLAGTTLLLAGVAWLAGTLPARRATRVDPVRALTRE